MERTQHLSRPVLAPGRDPPLTQLTRIVTDAYRSFKEDLAMIVWWWSGQVVAVLVSLVMMLLMGSP